MRISLLIAALTLVPLPALADALADARAAYLAAWEAAPLAVAKAAFVSEPAAGYGLFEERGSNVFSPDEPLYIYLEPVAYGWKPSGSAFQIGMSVGLTIRTDAAAEVFTQDDFLQLTTTSAGRPTEFFGNVTLNLSGLPVGAYVLELRLDDIASDKATAVKMPFELR